MDERKNLIIIKGENRTWELVSCRYNPTTKYYDVVYANNSKAYHYSGSLSKN